MSPTPLGASTTEQHGGVRRTSTLRTARAFVDHERERSEWAAVSCVKAIKALGRFYADQGDEDPFERSD
ncbi:MAG: hypothetical protein H0U21_16415 [Acidimicrobiia bacterium]|nr:hypothetical protein [Acidimicrobiia bacterium]